jgi:DNA replication protein DnaC
MSRQIGTAFELKMPEKDCPQCDGTGWKPIEAEGLRRVVRCDCTAAERLGSLLQQARIPRRYEHCAFENFDIRRDKETGQENLTLRWASRQAEKFVEEYPVDFGLLFVGPTGVGKTHLAVAVLRELALRKGVECLFYDFRDLLKEIRDSYNPVSQTSELGVLQPVLDVEVLLLDELVAANPSDWVKETVAHIINSRYNQKHVTLITTTLPLSDGSNRREVRDPSGEPVPNLERSLNQFGVTLSSRLYEMCRLLDMQSDDFRKAIRRAGHRFDNE